MEFTEKDAFKISFQSFQEKRKKQLEIVKILEEENLKQKRSLIERLKQVIENEEKIGAAFSIQKEIHETWKKTGEIPRVKRDEIQKEYSRLMELFFYNIKIYRELKEHDYHRNSQLKKENYWPRSRWLFIQVVQFKNPSPMFIPESA